MKTDPHNPEVVARAPTDVEAAAIVTVLSANGIKASATGGYTAGFIAEAPGDVAIVVRQVDVERAKKVLADMENDQDDFDWDDVNFGQPEDAEEF